MDIKELKNKAYDVLDEAEENLFDEGGITDGELDIIHEKVEHFIEVLTLLDKYGDELEIAHELAGGM